MRPTEPVISNKNNTKIKSLSPIKALRRKRRLKAARALLGIWAEKDTSYFDKR
jgi:hypothetical protein